MSGFRCTWVGPQSYVVALDDTCFVAKEGEDPVKVTRSPWQDVITKTQIGFSNRANQYEDDVCQESDQAAINRFGLRVEEPVSFDFIRTLTSATFAANMRVKRSVSIRNTYEFVLPFIYSYLEPMDIVTITTSSAWAAGLNNLSLGFTNLPVRITKVEDDPVAGLKMTAEDYQALAAEPVLFNKQISSASVLVNQWAQPGNSEVVMFEATSGTTAADSAGSNTGTYVATVTLDQSESTHAASGSPAIAWKQNTFLAGQAQILRSRVPLSIGPIQVTTPATGSGTPGTGGGTGGGGKQYY